MVIKRIILFFCILFCAAAHPLTADPLTIAEFSAASLAGWEDKVFKGTTVYRLADAAGQTVLAADSRDSASGLVKKVRVDLTRYPWLNWRWRIENRLDIENETVKPGDDYAARIYVVVSGGLLPWRARAISYVWANGAARGATWPNAFAGPKAMMMALRSRPDRLSTWYTEKRNVYADLKQLFGSEFQFIDAVALMTDTDNSHGQAQTYYGDIYFSKE